MSVGCAVYVLLVPPNPSSYLAFVDESSLEHDTRGFYVLAAVTFDLARHEDVREMLCALRGRRRISKLHWNEMDRVQQMSAAKQLADVDGVHVVAVGSAVPPRKQERARGKCLRQLVYECVAREISGLVLESRTPKLDSRDSDVMQAARFGLPAGVGFTIDHRPGCEEPLLWAADIVAGVVRAALDGRPAAC